MHIKKIVPLFLIIIATTIFFTMEWHRYISFDSLAQNSDFMQKWVLENNLLSVFIFIVAYMLITAMSIPGAVFITLLGGYLFGLVWGSLYVVFGATLGASLIFIAAKTAFTEVLRGRAAPFLKKLQTGFQENAFSYLLFLRLVPLFPFWLVNLAPAFLGVNFRTYFVATFFGIIPGTIVYVSVGNGMGVLIKKGQTPNLGIIFEPQILLPILGLAFLSLIPVLYKKYKEGKKCNQS
jgi:uncharacterized membrane protein YdjX (TVP38/TMEM64 family)